METANYTKMIRDLKVILSRGVSLEALTNARTKVEELMNNPVRPLTKQETVFLNCFQNILMEQ
jgi:hypothetical protein